MKIVKTNQLKTVIFTAVKNRCMLHGRFCNDYKKKQVILHSLISFTDVFYTYSSFRPMHTSETEHLRKIRTWVFS